MTVKEYAANKGVSKQSVYDRIRRGTLQVEMIDGVKNIVGERSQGDLFAAIESGTDKKCRKALKRSRRKVKLRKTELKGLRDLLQAKDSEIDTLKKSLGLVQAVIDSRLLKPVSVDTEIVKKKKKK